MNPYYPVVMLKIHKHWHPSISPEGLYEATRGVWKMGDRRHGARFALAVADGIVQEVYQIDGWQPAGTASYATRVPEEEVNDLERRWEFKGTVAESAVRDLYLGLDVSHLHKRGDQSPFRYFNCR